MLLDRNNIVNKFVNPFNLPGIHYICTACEDDTIPKEEEMKQDRSKENKTTPKGMEQPGSKEQKTNPKEVEKHDQGKGKVTTPEPCSQTPSNNKESDDAEVTIPLVSTDAIQPDEEQHPRVLNEANHTTVERALPATEVLTKDGDKITLHQAASPSGPQIRADPPPDKIKTICRYFRRGTCKHGLRGNDCKYLHPQMCRKFVQHGTRQPTGCNQGKKCKQFHPLMCLNSLTSNECLDENCSYNHIKGTRRQPTLIKKDDHQKEQSPPNNRETSINTKPIENSQNINSEADHFLEAVRLLKAEILSTMNTQIAALTTQIQNIQQIQAQPMPVQQMPYYPPIHPQVNPQVAQILHGTQQRMQLYSFQTPQRN